MQDLYQRYRKLKIDGSYIGLEKGEEDGGYFCTPKGAKIIGWDNGIHYCFIDGFEEIIFCVNPDTCCEYYVYPLAKNFKDFIGLILTTKNTNVMQQVILWDKAIYEEFINDPENIEYINSKKVLTALDKLRTLEVDEIEDPFEYIKNLQREFDYDKIEFTNEYYDTLGLERPDGSECEYNPVEFTGEFTELYEDEF